VSRFFIDRPIFAGVISVFITLAGLIAVGALTLPVAQYPDITPPTVAVSCFYTGANAKVVEETVASPIEQQIIGVENMLYMSSQSTNDGGYNLTVTFKVGTNLDMAQVLVQNRVNLALPLLPAEVKQTGVSVKKKSPSILLVVNVVSPNQTRDQLYLSNYVTIRLKDELAQLDGVGDVALLGQLDYSMRVWLDPDEMASHDLTATDVVNALKEQNVQVAAGAIGRPPVPLGQQFQYTLSTLGRLTEPEQFEQIVLKTGTDGELVKLKDVISDPTQDGDSRIGGVVLGAKNEDTACRLDGQPAIGMAIYQLPGSNALSTADRIRQRMDELKLTFPPDVDYTIAYDTTPFIEESIHEVFKALRDAIILVAIVVLAFLQSWRATLIPLIAVPVAIVGTFSVMYALDFSLNNLSLFGLVLAIGIVVDDAIVVVEAVEHHIEHGLAPKEAAIKAMQEVTGPIIAISLVLMCVFIPCAFISGITGQFFRQFALTIAASTFFSAINSLTLSPALCAILLKPKAEQTDILSRFLNLILGWFYKLFNIGFSVTSNMYAKFVGGLIRVSLIVLVVYGGLLYATYFSFTSVPIGFIPDQDKGYLLLDIQLPDSASLERTMAVTKKIEKICLGEIDKAAAHDPAHAGDEHHATNRTGGVPGVLHTMAIPGQSFVQNAIGSNFGAMFVILDAFHHRLSPELNSNAIAMKIRARVAQEIEEANVAVFGAPSVDGLGNAGGFKLMVRDVGSYGLDSLQANVTELTIAGSQQPGILGMVSSFRARTPQLYVDVDRNKCKTMDVPLNEVYLALQLYLGGYYTNDFNQFGRTWQVNIKGDPRFLLTPDQIGRLRVRNLHGETVPLGTVIRVDDFSGPAMITRYNGIKAVTINGLGVPGASTGEIIKTVGATADEVLPDGMDYQWTEITLLQILAGNTAIVVFGMAVVLVFLVLAAQYESLTLPFAVILVVPMCLLSSIIGVATAHLDINIFVQIGFVVLVGLASKNAILIVEFAKEQFAKGVPLHESTVEACRVRLRPIMMTSFAFILGVVPLAIAVGAGAEMRRALGIAVASGMLGVTFFGIFLTPIFYYVIMWMFVNDNVKAPTSAAAVHATEVHG
jgi:multidrug efflux pump